MYNVTINNFYCNGKGFLADCDPGAIFLEKTSFEINKLQIHNTTAINGAGLGI